MWWYSGRSSTTSKRLTSASPGRGHSVMAAGACLLYACGGACGGLEYLIGRLITHRACVFHCNVCDIADPSHRLESTRSLQVSQQQRKLHSA
ncbi:hypothetical protein MRB53_037698 [Persea americana]|nr:hypothetical protein MRB53_037698 [Persea americana]